MKNFLAGKTNSPIIFPNNYPKNIVSGQGAYVISGDGTAFIDLWMGYGALLNGHQHEHEKINIKKQLDKGWFFSYPSILETLVAEKLHFLIPSAERIRFSVSGSDAVAYAIRASRKFTNRSKVLTVEGGYHGVHENIISNVATLSADKPDFTKFNNITETCEKILTKKYACFILEPVLANDGCVPPISGYLEAVRNACNQSQTVLIFDEVVTGFRVSIGGAQLFFEITPDLSTFSKAISGGFPLSMVCGKQEIMEQFIPTGEVFFAGTFNGFPISLANTLNVIETLETSYSYEKISKFRENFSKELIKLAKKHGIKLAIQGIASMMSLAFDCDSYIHGVHEARANSHMYSCLADYMAKTHSILLPPLFSETIFLAPVHIEIEKKLLEAFDNGFEWLAKNFKR